MKTPSPVHRLMHTVDIAASRSWDAGADGPYRQKVFTLTPVAQLLLAHDLTPGFELRSMGLEPSLLLDEEAWLGRSSAASLLTLIADRTGDPLAGLRVSSLTHMTDWGSCGERILGARSLGEAIMVGAREIARVHTGVELSLAHRGNDALVRVGFPGSLPCESRQYIEASLMMVRKLLDLAVEPVPALACLPYDSAATEGLESMLRARLAFRSPYAQLMFRSDALRLPLRFPGAARGGGSALPNAQATALGAMRALQDLILFERPTAEAVANALSMTVRSMQRHLSQWGITFREMLDQHRRRMALLYLETDGCTVTDAAFHLGYSDTAHFIRAFRRWTGHSPRQVPDRAAAPPLTAAQNPGPVDQRQRIEAVSA